MDVKSVDVSTLGLCVSMKIKQPMEGKNSSTENDPKQLNRRKEAHFRCPIESCGRVFNRSYNFKAHMRLHNGDKPYKCTFESCTERFKWRSSLMNHIRRHAKDDTKNAEVPTASIRSFESIGSNVTYSNEEEEFYTEVRTTLKDSSPKLSNHEYEEYFVDDNVLCKNAIIRFV